MSVEVIQMMVHIQSVPVQPGWATPRATTTRWAGLRLSSPSSQQGWGQPWWWWPASSWRRRTAGGDGGGDGDGDGDGDGVVNMVRFMKAMLKVL